MKSSNELVLALAAAALTAGSAGVACQRNLDRPASTVTYTARQPRPDSTAVTTRAIDSTGWVDNNGTTSDERARTELSGMRATEMGSERVTGTPGSGTPIPLEPRPGRRVGEAPGALGGEEPGASGAPGETIIGRLAQAICDRETVCDRVGPKGRFRTGEECLSVLRERARGAILDAGCERGFDNTSVGVCLTAIRQARCDARLATIEEIPACARTQLCSP